MTPPIFLATLGQRPEAITMALDVLLPRHGYVQVGLLHTEPTYSGIAAAFQALTDVLAADYPLLTVITHELRFADGQPLYDIDTQHSAETYYAAVYEVLKRYRSQHVPIHLLVAGGRKAMSIYATLAASLLFGIHDRVLTVLSTPELIERSDFHAPPGYLDAVQIVTLPLLPARLLPDIAVGMDVDTIHKRRSNPRVDFLASLSPQEQRLAEALQAKPYASNDDLAADLSKSRKTIENQLNAIYVKLLPYYDLGVEGNRKRQALVDVLIGRV